MSDFTYSPCIIGGQTAPGDYVIRYRGGEPLARVCFYQSGPTDCWHWNTFTYPCASGKAERLPAALDAVKRAVLDLPEPARIKHNGPGAGRRRRVPPDYH
ncbi:hypothetical protein [Thalassococcus sp. S3]|uniref:hypothetical protein n=1 Tax=Thalassococcus sp. S3 TaxID=2017482 RepID=UPI0010248E0B|nr:hypothetical protein [Thalassococcus sp. S3]QBF31502.1 hypothetical protein CFI11_09775 [Thalassococcus sp. S3]